MDIIVFDHSCYRRKWKHLVDLIDLWQTATNTVYLKNNKVPMNCWPTQEVMGRPIGSRCFGTGNISSQFLARKKDKEGYPMAPAFILTFNLYNHKRSSRLRVHVLSLTHARASFANIYICLSVYMFCRLNGEGTKESA